MNSTDTAELLRRYVREGSQPAFTALVERYTPVVYGAALRHTGQRDVASDVAQKVFTDLARRAPAMTWDDRLGAWLHRRAVFAAADAMKSETRRLARETEAFHHMHPSPDDGHAAPSGATAAVLDKAMLSLSTADRHALTLRYLEERDLKAVGVALGISGDAAQKRISRALEKLRGLLARRGAALATTVALTHFLTSEAQAQAQVPAGLAKSLAARALQSGAGGWWWLKTWPAVRAALAGAAGVAAIAAVPLWKQEQRLAGAFPSAATAPAATKATTANAVPSIRQLQKMPRVEANLTLEEVVRRLAMVIRAPQTELIRMRGHALQDMIKPEQSLRALTLLGEAFPEGFPDWAWVLGDLDPMYKYAARQDAPATLAWIDAHVWDPEWRVGAFCTALAASGVHSVEELGDWLPRVMKCIRPNDKRFDPSLGPLLHRLTKELPFDEAVRKMVELTARFDSLAPLAAVQIRLTDSGRHAPPEEWQELWRALQSVPSPHLRSNARLQMLRKWADTATGDAQAWVSSLSEAEWPLYARQVALPARNQEAASETASRKSLEDWTPHVDWLNRIDPNSVTGVLSDWHRYAPAQVQAWLESHPSLVTPALEKGGIMSRLVDSVRTDALPEDETRRAQIVQRQDNSIKPLVELWRRTDPAALELFIRTNAKMPAEIRERYFTPRP